MRNLPVTVTVNSTGAVTVANPVRVVAMSRFSNCAKRLSLDFGSGVHVIASEQDVEDIPTHTLADIAEALEG